MTHTLPNDMHSLLEIEIQAVNKIHQLMLQEHQLLITRDLELLQKLTTEKIQLMQEIEQITLSRFALLDLAPDSPQHLIQEKIAHQFNQDANTMKLWDQLQELAKSCKALNQQNGAIIHSSQNALGQLRKLLCGDAAGLTLYGAKGELRESLESRPLSSA